MAGLNSPHDLPHFTWTPFSTSFFHGSHVSANEVPGVLWTHLVPKATLPCLECPHFPPHWVVLTAFTGHRPKTGTLPSSVGATAQFPSHQRGHGLSFCSESTYELALTYIYLTSRCCLTPQRPKRPSPLCLQTSRNNRYLIHVSGRNECVLWWDPLSDFLETKSSFSKESR